MVRVEPCPKCLSTDIWFRRKDSLNGDETEYCELRCADCNHTLEVDINSPKTLDEARKKWNDYVFTEAKRDLNTVRSAVQLIYVLSIHQKS